MKYNKNMKYIIIPALIIFILPTFGTQYCVSKISNNGDGNYSCITEGNRVSVFNMPQNEQTNIWYNNTNARR